MLPIGVLVLHTDKSAFGSFFSFLLFLRGNLTSPALNPLIFSSRGRLEKNVQCGRKHSGQQGRLGEIQLGELQSILFLPFARCVEHTRIILIKCSADTTLHPLVYLLFYGWVSQQLTSDIQTWTFECAIRNI